MLSSLFDICRAGQIIIISLDTSRTRAGARFTPRDGFLSIHKINLPQKANIENIGKKVIQK